MILHYIIYGQHSDTIKITEGIFKNAIDFKKHCEKNHKFVVIVYFAPYRFLCEDVMSEILTMQDKNLYGLDIAVNEYLARKEI